MQCEHINSRSTRSQTQTRKSIAEVPWKQSKTLLSLSATLFLSNSNLVHSWSNRRGCRASPFLTQKEYVKASRSGTLNFQITSSNIVHIIDTVDREIDDEYSKGKSHVDCINQARTMCSQASRHLKDLRNSKWHGYHIFSIHLFNVPPGCINTAEKVPTRLFPYAGQMPIKKEGGGNSSFLIKKLFRCKINLSEG